MTVNDVLLIIGIVAIISGASYLTVIAVAFAYVAFREWKDRRK